MCPPSIQEELDDSINAYIRETDRKPSLATPKDMFANETNGKQNGNGFTYTILSNDNQFTISYSLEESSRIHAMVVDVMGNIYRDIQQHKMAGSDYSMHFDCSDLRPGQYIIYINVNGVIYNIKIPVK